MEVSPFLARKKGTSVPQTPFRGTESIPPGDFGVENSGISKVQNQVHRMTISKRDVKILKRMCLMR